MDITVKEISERLATKATQVAPMLLPGGREVKGEWCVGDISGSPGDSLKIHLTGKHAGHWQDWAEQSQKGDLLDLWAAVRGVALPEAIRQAKDWLGISDGVGAAAPKKYGSAPKRDDIKPLSPAGKAMQFLCSKRRLDTAIVNRFKIEGDGTAIVFPCYSPSGQLVNRSYRTLGAEKKVWQDKGCAPCLFGWHALSEDAYRRRTVLLCEGQIDAASWTQLGIPALSIPNGSGQTWIEYEWDNLAAFDTIYISFDMDGAGQENAKKAIHRLGNHRCLVVSIPHKDANDCLMAGATSADAAQWIDDAKAPRIKDLVQANELKQRLLADLIPKPDAFTLPFLRTGEPGEGYFARPGEVTIWTGTTGHGKSTFLNYFILSVLSTGTPAFVASLEMKAETLMRKMMTSMFNKKVGPEDADGFLGEVGHLLIFADRVGSIGRAELFDMITFSQRRYGVAHCFIDSLMRVDGLEEEYVEQGKFLNDLQKVAKTSGVHVHMVAHPRKLADDDKPGKMDVKGSSLIPNNADNIIAICRNMEKERLRKNGEITPGQEGSMWDTEVRVEKQRETGWEGRFLLRFDRRSYCYSVFSPTQTQSTDRKKWND